MPTSYAIFLFSALLGKTTPFDTGTTPETTTEPPKKCETVADLDYPRCDFEHLPISELKAICAAVGQDIERDMFSWMLDEDDEINHETYAEAASMCHDMMSDRIYARVDHPEDIAKEMMTKNHELLDALLEDMIENEPEKVDQVEQKVKMKDTVYYDEMIHGYGSDHKRSMILSEMIFELSAGDTKFFDSLGLDITKLLTKNDKEDEDEDEDEVNENTDDDGFLKEL
mmetsp:Transcript_12449/g.15590  ORF Transcript_12449/g.15590 Transcript_12449/m.15590 type:complete len:227 (-) Transcript_12449:64-744(-)|eukprot:CAMPEP_0172512678 /NCGR_PEP_ID=MMETSP1066-20121228/246454_1 /TAXON_ID=671091 /ORGANISM="Coscinodiscus wailesii, Strain CCMP2513" /LENGTH=226 /DNA_ID=CAMNT_0013292593 /DNA_START=88 /DNA_END=768 /DNA_ORIENTATION=-